jgi:hypothetical protein
VSGHVHIVGVQVRPHGRRRYTIYASNVIDVAVGDQYRYRGEIVAGEESTDTFRIRWSIDHHRWTP